MRAYEFILDETINRKQPITLKWLHKLKIRQNKLQTEKRRKATFLAVMYGQEDQHELRLKQIELEKEELELKRLQSEYDQLIIEPMIKSSEAIIRLSRSAMRQRKK